MSKKVIVLTIAPGTDETVKEPFDGVETIIHGGHEAPVGPTLSLYDANGSTLAVFSPGSWSYVRVVES